MTANETIDLLIYIKDMNRKRLSISELKAINHACDIITAAKDCTCLSDAGRDLCEDDYRTSDSKFLFFPRD
jgi:hypothetical protein